MSYVIPLIQARMDSERMACKVMMEMAGKPMLAHLVDACKNAGLVPTVVTPVSMVNDPIRLWCRENDTSYSSWPVQGVRDPLAEFAYAVRNNGNYAWVLRLTADCPMIEPHHISLFTSILEGEENYFTNRPADMDGYDLEAFTVRMLRRTFRMATSPYDREHICPWMHENSYRSRIVSVMGNPHSGVTPGKVSVDTPAEFDYVKRLLEERQP